MLSLELENLIHQLHDRLERRRGFTVCTLYILKLQYKVHACV
jgi:hypothetical protein